MSEHSFIVLFVSVYVFISLIGVSSTEYVPVYMWETTQFSEIVPALERVSQESFRKIVLDRATKNTPILLFAEQNLSPEDFILDDAEGKTPFSHLASLRASAQVSYWPSVKNPTKVVTELPSRTKVETSIKSILDDPEFTIRNNDVLIVDLNDAKEGEDRIQMLKRHDRDIIAVYKRLLKEHENIITLFTAHFPSWIISEELRSHRRIRDVAKEEPAAEEVDTYRIYNNTDVLIYINSTATISNNGTVVNLDGYKIRTKDKTSEGMDIIFESDTNKTVTVTFNFKFNSGYWLMSNVVVHNESSPDDDKDYNLQVREVYAPEGFSYHCNAQSFIHIEHKQQYLTLPGFQVQVYGENNTQETQAFGDAYDCVGFMTAPIWSGLFVTFILALIMTFGLTMMMDIKTMDRFDDPKGKTITISATE